MIKINTNNKITYINLNNIWNITINNYGCYELKRGVDIIAIISKDSIVTFLQDNKEVMITDLDYFFLNWNSNG